MTDAPGAQKKFSGQFSKVVVRSLGCDEMFRVYVCTPTHKRMRTHREREVGLLVAQEGWVK